ncbi:MAG: 3'(2'),5'-bisphosphate nucleotidase CysQ, partial [Nitrospirae bacterium]|nr:3'(2'),5'-bisphosphate nucleotidase CysQ [Nitrospirota bacterium]
MVNSKMTTMDEGRMENYLAGAIAAAGEAGAAVLDVYNTDFAVSYKEDRSPLTEADRESHAIILGCLNSLSPRFPVLSEEGADIPYETRRRWEYFWLVDPLDGTKEFVKRNGEFTVNIALIHKNRPVIGVVYLPVTSACYFAAEGFGAYRHVRGDAATQNPSLEVLLKNSRRLPLSLRVGGSVVVVASRSHRTGEGEAFVEELRERYDRVDLVSAGSSLKFCLVAEGTADIYP